MQTGLATLYSRASIGIEAPLITVEVHLANGLPGFNIVGLPEASVREAKDRVRSALINSQLEFPAKKITVNLAPADLPKEGARFDLAIAIGILAASGQLPDNQLADYELTGELALSGKIRPIQGILPFAHSCHQAKRQLILPRTNLEEARLIKDVKLLAACQLMDVFHHLNGQQPLNYASAPAQAETPGHAMDMQDVIAQQAAKRALQIAAAGGHNVLLTGPPGTGKTMLAQRLISILPPMTETEALETATIYSVTGKPLELQRWRQRPFRHPHHTCSAVALVGGGSNPRP